MKESPEGSRPLIDWKEFCCTKTYSEYYMLTNEEDITQERLWHEAEERLKI